MPNEDAHDTWMSMAAKWLFGQDATTVLLFAVLGFGGYAFYHAGDVMIPQHIKALNDNAEKIAKDHSDEVQQLSTLFERQSEKQHELIQRLLPTAKAEAEPVQPTKPQIAGK
ncbi:MAG: hypothetical protein KGL39_54660 [Patescibacteria group bacterium]|nr:hypothetical protein [Patescibacteria group bacterium]